MIVDKKDILQMLSEGIDPSKIADEFVTMLNEAVVEQKEAEAAAAQKQDQLEAAAILLAAFESYVADYCPRLAAEVNANPDEEMTPEDIIEIMDGLDNAMVNADAMAEKFQELGAALGDLFNLAPMVAKPEEGYTPVLPDNIHQFLSKNGLL